MSEHNTGWVCYIPFQVLFICIADCFSTSLVKYPESLKLYSYNRDKSGTVEYNKNRSKEVCELFHL